MPQECEEVSVMLQLNGKIEKMMLGIESVKEKQDLMADDISKIKEAVYNPDEGLYARIRELEAWKANSSRLIWIILTAMIGLTSASVWNLLTSN